MLLSRRLIQELMIASPLIFVVGLAAGTRTHVDDFVQVGYSAELQRRIEAYREPVLAASAIAPTSQSQKEIEALRRIAAKWCDQSEKGILLPLPSAFSRDSVQDGVKSEISQAAQKLCAGLQRAALSELRLGEFDKSAQDAMLGIEVGQVLKYSDLYSVGLFSARQHYAQEVLAESIPNLSKGTGKEILARLRRVRDRDEPIVTIALRARRQYVAEGRRLGVERQEIEDASRLIYVGDLMDRNAEPEQIRRAISNLILASNAVEAPPYYSEFQFAWKAHQAQSGQIEELIEQLSLKR